MYIHTSKNLTELLILEGTKKVYCFNNQLTELTLPDKLLWLECDHSVKLINVKDHMNIEIYYF